MLRQPAILAVLLGGCALLDSARPLPAGSASDQGVDSAQDARVDGALDAAAADGALDAAALDGALDAAAMDAAAADGATDARAGTRVACSVQAGPIDLTIEVDGAQPLRFARVEGSYRHCGANVACGAAQGDEQTASLPRAVHFQLAEVTRAQWAAFSPLRLDGDAECNQPECPVVNVTWAAAAHFANLLSQEVALVPCYDLDCDDPSGLASTFMCEGASAQLNACGYRLPTNAEWELVAREGHGAFGVVEGLECGDGCAAGAIFEQTEVWCAQAPRPVMGMPGRQPNCFGVRDMLGNVREWVHDSGGRCGPAGPDRPGTPVARGGYYGSMRVGDLAADARLESQGGARQDTGFRLAIEDPTE